MGPLIDQLVQISGRNLQIVRDAVEFIRIELMNLVELAPMIQPFAERLGQPLENGRGMILDCHGKLPPANMPQYATPSQDRRCARSNADAAWADFVKGNRTAPPPKHAGFPQSAAGYRGPLARRESL